MNYQAGYNDGVNGNSAKYRSVSEYMRGFRAGEEERIRSSRMYSRVDENSNTYDSSVNLADVARVVETVVDLFSSDSSSSSSSDFSSDWGGGGGDFGGGGSSSDW